MPSHLNPTQLTIHTKQPGIGLAISQYLLNASTNLIVLARSSEPLKSLQSSYPAQVRVLTGNLADLSLGQRAVDMALAEFGRLDGLVLNHGILGQVGKLADTDVEEWRKGFDVNFFSLVAFVRLFFPWGFGRESG